MSSSSNNNNNNMGQMPNQSCYATPVASRRASATHPSSTEARRAANDQSVALPFASPSRHGDLTDPLLFKSPAAREKARAVGREQLDIDDLESKITELEERKAKLQRAYDSRENKRKRVLLRCPCVMSVCCMNTRPDRLFVCFNVSFSVLPFQSGVLL
jgi:hypothetical protein